MKKGWLVILALVAVVAVVVVVSVMKPQATVDVIRPKVQTIRAYVEEQAVTELPHDHLISMPISGWLEPIRLREGDTVSQDEIVARLETDDLRDRALQAEQRIAVLEAKIAETSDHRLEENALIETEATVKAIDETVKASEAKLEASKALVDFTLTEVHRLKGLVETASAAERELRKAEMELRRAQAEYQSDLLKLAALKTIAAVSYIGPKFIRDYTDRKSFTLQQQQKELIEAKSQLEIERRNLSRAEIRSPVDGVVLRRLQTRRQFLPAGTPLLTIGQPSDLEIIAEVLTQRAAHIEPDDPVEVYGQALADGPIQGKVFRVYPAGFKKISSLGVEQQRVNVAIKLDERPERLGVGFRVYVRIFHDQAESAVTIPRTAMFRGDDGGWNVMLVHEGRTVLRSITVGLMNDDLVQITGGLSADEWVIARPSREIVQGMRVDTTGG